MKKVPTILVIFGISGDLSKRYLLPAIGAIAKAKMLPEDFHIIGITRKSDLSVDSLLKEDSDTKYIRKHIDLYKIDVTKKDEYIGLDNYLKKIEKSFSIQTERIFYLSVPPEACKPIVELIGKSALNKGKFSKLMLEKPFGRDLKSAKDLIKHINQYFKENEVYRIDHYLAKEASQNIIVFRDGNSLFKKTWNKDFIESIDIIASEEIGIEGRAHFYEQTGALRDYIQSHLLQLAALVLMDLLKKYDLNEIPYLRYKALKHLSVVNVKRGQYEGYIDEVKNPNTKVETFVSVKLKSSDPRWKNVPIILTTGKALKGRFTEIKICYKKNEKHESNELLLRLQPDAGIKFSVWAKRPGYERELVPHVLHFNFKDYYPELPEAYEQVLFNAINSDHSLFTLSEEVLESWRILDPVQKKWQKSGADLIIYPKGSKIEEITKNGLRV